MQHIFLGHALSRSLVSANHDDDVGDGGGGRVGVGRGPQSYSAGRGLVINIPKTKIKYKNYESLSVSKETKRNEPCMYLNI